MRPRFGRRGVMTVQALEDRFLLSGVTIVTHGFNSNADFWVDSFADEVIARVAAETPFQESDVAKYEMTITGSGVAVTQESTQSYITAASGETVIRLDWGALAGTLFNMQGETSTDEVAPTIADYIFSNQSWIVEGRLHLIGHSRGASLVTALAAEFGKRGVWVDQTTFLDPHPRTASEASDPDFPMDIPENVVFADGYWREGSGIFNPDGEHVPGAFNVQLNEAHFSGGSIGYGGFLTVDTHADVHLWYHGTIDNVGGFSDSGETVAAADAAYWYAPDAYDSVAGNLTAGRDDIGYVFSRVVGKERPDVGVAQALGGQGLRDSLDWSSAVWPSLLELTIDAADLDFGIGESIPVSYYYQDADSNANVQFYLDADQNPYNGNATMVGPSSVLLGGTTALTLDSKNLPTAGVLPGSYYVSARITDSGGLMRWAYALKFATLEVPVMPPVVNSTTVNGSGDANRSGIREVTFNFSEAVTVAAATSLNLFNHTTGQSIDLSAATLAGNGTAAVTWNLTGVTLPNGRYTAELPAAATTSNFAQTHTFEFHKQAGDVDGDGFVNFNDFFEVDVHFNTSGSNYKPGDADGDGFVNFNDFFAVDSNFNTSVLLLSLDFGDAPDSATFPTTLANDGARHVITGNLLRLGTLRDGEADGESSIDATGDDVNNQADEDGIVIVGDDLVVGTSVDVTVTANVPTAAVLNGWVDFNQDGDWDDTGEQVFVDTALADGTNNLSIAVPLGATLGTTFARFRITETTSYSYFGLAPNGEVEDYLLTITDPPPPVPALLASVEEQTSSPSPSLISVPLFSTPLFGAPLTSILPDKMLRQLSLFTTMVQPTAVALPADDITAVEDDSPTSLTGLVAEPAGVVLNNRHQ